MTHEMTTIDRRPTVKEYLAYTAIVLALAIVALLILGGTIYFVYGIEGARFTGWILLAVGIVAGILVVFKVVSAIYAGAKRTQNEVLRAAVELVREGVNLHADVVGTYEAVVTNDDKRDIELIKALNGIYGGERKVMLEQARIGKVEAQAALESVKTDERLRYMLERESLRDERATQRAIETQAQESSYYSDLPEFDAGEYKLPEVD